MTVPYECPECRGFKANRYARRCWDCWNASRRSTRPSAGREYAQAHFPLTDLCERCGVVPPIDRHHIDGNPLNNVQENIQCLCRRCHQEVDGRLYMNRGRRVTHCKHGHEYTSENTYTSPSGVRSCRMCRAAYRVAA